MVGNEALSKMKLFQLYQRKVKPDGDAADYHRFLVSMGIEGTPITQRDFDRRKEQLRQLQDWLLTKPDKGGKAQADRWRREQYMKNLWRWKIGMDEKHEWDWRGLEKADDLLKDNFYYPFIELMENRMKMGAFRYGPLFRQNLKNYDTAVNARRRIERYIRTRNKECLVDAANMLMIEFARPSRKGTYFSSEDDGEHAIEKV